MLICKPLWAQVDPADVKAVALAWLIELETCDVQPPRLQLQFEQWRDADPAHAAAFERCKQFWGAFPTRMPC